jgi:hypothetical protein
MKGTVHIKGRSTSPEAQDYFNEFLPYLKDCTKKRPTDFRITMELEYFSTKTSKILMDFFGIIKDEIVGYGFDASVDWVIEDGDEDMLETAQDYEYLTQLKFNIIKKPEFN